MRGMGWRVHPGLWTTLAGATVGVILLNAQPARTQRPTPIDGFTAETLATQHAIEQRLARFPSTRRLDADHRFLTARPHPAGSPRDRLLAEWTRDEWRAAGLDSVEIVEHDVLLPHAGEIAVDMIEPHRWSATLREGAGDEE